MSPTMAAAISAPIASRSRLTRAQSNTLSSSRGAAATLIYFMAALVTVVE